MKINLSTIKRIVPMLIFTFTSAAIYAQDFEQDNISYSFLSKEEHTVKVVYNTYSPYVGDITIPPRVEYEGDTYTVTALGDQAFFKCADLYSVSIPATVTDLGRYTFSNCISLESVELPNSITTIPEGCFVYCSSLTSVDLPLSVTTIGKFGFGYCSNLSQINLHDGLTSFGDMAFIGCAMGSVNVPSGITELPQFCFALSNNLTSITLHNNIKSIGSNAFEGDSQLSHITLPEGLVSLGSRTFANCPSLTHITIPDGVSEIPSQCFFNDMALQTIVCGRKVTNFAPDILVRYKDNDNEPSLKDLYLMGDAMVSGGDAIMSEACANATLHVKPELLEAYKASFEWGEFKNIVALTEDETAAVSLTPTAEKTANCIYYMLNGKKASAHQKGILIKNGKKTLYKMH